MGVRTDGPRGSEDATAVRGTKEDPAWGDQREEGKGEGREQKWIWHRILCNFVAALYGATIAYQEHARK